LPASNFFMPEKSRAQLLDEMETLHKRLEETERALAESRKELRQARKTSTSLARSNQRSEQAGKSSSDAFDWFYSWCSDLVFRLAKDGRVLALSPSCRHLLGFAPEELQGRLWWDLLEKKSRRQALQFFQTLIQGEQPAHATWSWCTQTGQSLEMEAHCRTVWHPQIQEQQIIGLARPLQVSSSPVLTGSQAWLPVLVHELKQPLTAIINYTRACIRLLENDQAEKVEMLKALEQTAQQAERAGELLQRARRWAVPKELQRAPWNINDVVRESLQSLQGELRQENVQLDLQLADNLPPVQVDGLQIGQVLVNLIRNAIEALAHNPPTQRTISISTQSTATEVEVVISDTGEGLSPEMAHRLFEPFQTTKPHGMGLGLALSRAIVQAHGGRLWVKPQADRGTSFHFTLPLN
jgi:PAS domain S-box-containing protein